MNLRVRVGFCQSARYLFEYQARPKADKPRRSDLSGACADFLWWGRKYRRRSAATSTAGHSCGLLHGDGECVRSVGIGHGPALNPGRPDRAVASTSRPHHHWLPKQQALISN